MVKKLDTVLACDGQTDRQTSCYGIVRAMHTHHAVKMENHTVLQYSNMEMSNWQSNSEVTAVEKQRVACCVGHVGHTCLFNMK